MLTLYKTKGEKFYTKTSNYLVTMLGINVRDFMDMGWEDSYLGDCKRIYEMPVIHLLFKPEYDEEFADFCHDVKLHQNYIDDYDISDNEVVFVFKIPEHYLPQMEYFKEGKFSKFDEAYVKKAYPTHKDPRRKVCLKDPYLREKIEVLLGCTLPEDAELESLPLPEGELLNYDGKGWIY